MSVLERIYFLHQRIQAGRFPNATDLVEAFEISAATAHRDIAYLRDRLLAPIAFDPKRNGYFYSSDGFHLPFEDLPRIVLFLAIVQKMAMESGLEHLPELVRLQKTLSHLLNLTSQDPADLVHCEWVEVEPVDQQIFSTVLTALTERLQLDINYRKLAGQETRRRVEPLKLINYQGRWYLFAWCGLRQADRMFHLARIATAALRSESVTHPAPNASYLQGVFGIFKGEKRFQAVIRFRDKAAEIVRQQQWHPEQFLEEKGDCIELSLPAADDRELLMKILQFGSQAQVVAPAELKERVLEEIRKMAAAYAAMP